MSARQEGDLRGFVLFLTGLVVGLLTMFWVGVLREEDRMPQAGGNARSVKEYTRPTIVPRVVHCHQPGHPPREH